MKFNLKTLVITILLAGSIFSQDCPNVFNSVKDENCKKVVTTFKIGESGQQFPADLKKDNKAAYDNALAQTKAARMLFYKPNKEVVDLLKAAVLGLKTLFNVKETIPDFAKFIFQSKEQRQTSKTGTMQGYFKSASDLINGTDQEKKYATLKAVLINFAAAGEPTGVDILAFLGFIGDLGTCVQDTFWRKLDKCDTEDAEKKGVATAMATSVTNLDKDKAVAKDFYTRLSPDNFYVIEGKQNKKTERMNCDAGEKNMKFDVRSGVMNSGDDADAEIKKSYTTLGKTEGEPVLPKIGWPWQTIPEKLTKFCSKEPWAGHFSGSVHEQILMLHILSTPAENNKLDATKQTDKAKQKIIATLASAFLIATGMHSAIEVMVPVNNYLNGTSDKIDLDDKALAGKICGDTDETSATKWFVKLAESLTQKQKKRRKLK